MYQAFQTEYRDYRGNSTLKVVGRLPVDNQTGEWKEEPIRLIANKALYLYELGRYYRLANTSNKERIEEEKKMIEEAQQRRDEEVARQFDRDYRANKGRKLKVSLRERTRR